MTGTIQITTSNGRQLTLTPIPMDHMPSDSPEDWLKFMGRIQVGTDMPDAEVDRIQQFMRQHETEALMLDGMPVTIASNLLADCYPSYK